MILWDLLADVIFPISRTGKHLADIAFKTQAQMLKALSPKAFQDFNY